MASVMRRTNGIGLFLWSMCVLPALTVPVTAQVDGNDAGEKAYVNPGNMFPKAEEVVGIGAKLQEQLDRYLGDRGWKLGVSSANPGNAYIGWGAASIGREPDDVKYGEARIAAFHRAFADAKGKFVRSRQEEVLTEIRREFLSDDLPEDSTETGKLAYIRECLSIAAEKGVALGEGHLDKLLREVGVDPADYPKVGRVGREKRKTILRDAIGQTITTRAVASLRGLRIVTTFEDLRSVGVLVMHSEESERIARQIARGEAVSRRPAEVVTGSIQDMLAKTLPNDVDYIGVHGIRIMRDDAGENVVVAFGQWAPSITKTTSRALLEGRTRAARDMAERQAEAALVDFINSTLVFEATAKFKEFQDIRRITLDSRMEEVDTYEIGTRAETIVRQYGSAKLEGATTIKTWAANNPRTGHVLVGHVLMWSPSTRDVARGKFLKQEEGKPAGKVKYDNTVIEGPALDHLDPTLRRP